MKLRKSVVVLLCCMVIFTAVGCSSETESAESIITVKSINGEVTVYRDIVGTDALVEIGDGLYYDSITGIVYWWNGIFSRTYSATVPTPYYSSNGLLFRYIPETKTLEEIKPIE